MATLPTPVLESKELVSAEWWGRVGYAAQGLGSRACEASTLPQSYNPSLQKAFYTNLVSMQIVKE